MKHFVLTVMIVGGLMIASPLFAAGAEEEAGATIAETWETTTLTGEISFADWPNPEITMRGTTYELLVPRFAVEEIGVSTGDTVTVTGVMVEDRNDGDEPVMMVISAEIDGEEYEVPRPGMADGRFGSGPAHGGRPPMGMDGTRVGRPPVDDDFRSDGRLMDRDDIRPGRRF